MASVTVQLLPKLIASLWLAKNFVGCASSQWIEANCGNNPTTCSPERNLLRGVKLQPFMMGTISLTYYSTSRNASDYKCPV